MLVTMSARILPKHLWAVNGAHQAGTLVGLWLARSLTTCSRYAGLSS